MIIALLLAGVLANGSAPSEPTSAATIATASAAASTSDGATLSTEDEPKVTTLANGMRIAVVRRRSLAADEAHRVAMRLHVTGGWLAERSSERGLVHLIEHMALEGSSKVSAEGVTTLRDQLTIAAEWGAWTSPEATEYFLTARDNDPATLDRLLAFLSGIAAGLTFDSAATDRQRQMVINEMAQRQPANRLQYERDHALAPGSALDLAEGYLSADVPTASVDTLRALYRRVYQPQAMLLTIVGDIDPATIEQLVAKQFGATASGERIASSQRPITPHLIASQRQLVSVDASPSGPPTVLLSFAVGQAEGRVSDAMSARDALLDQALTLLVNQRLSLAALREGVSAPSFAISDDRRGPRTFQLIAPVDQDDWQGAQRFLMRQLAALDAHGFGTMDADRARRKLLRQLADEHDWAPYASNARVAEAIGAAVILGSPPISADTRFMRDTDVVKSIDAGALNAAWLAMTQRAPLQVRVESAAAAADTNINSAIAGIASNRAALTAQAAAAPAPSIAATLIDPTARKPGRILSDVRSPEGVRRVIFANGTAIDLISRSHNGKWIELAVDIDASKARQRLTYCDAVAAPPFLSAGGSRHQSAVAISEAIVGSDMRLAPLAITGTGLATSVSVRKEDVETAIHLLHASLAQPGFRTDGTRAARAQLESNLAHRLDDPAWATWDAIERGAAAARTGRDVPFDKACIANSSMARIERTMRPILSHGRTEIAIAGNFDEAAMIRLLAATFGQDGKGASKASRPARVAKLPMIAVAVPPQLAGQTVRAALWSLPEAADVHDRAPQEVFNTAFSRMFYNRLIERDQLSYAFIAQRLDLSEWMGQPVFYAASRTSLESSSKLDAAFAAVAHDIQNTTLSPEQLEVARQLVRDSVRGSYNEDRVWAYQASQLGRQPNAVRTWRGIEAELPAVTAEDVLRYARSIVPLEWMAR